jgi:hypothetical protein
MADKKTMKETHKRTLRRESELRKINDVYTLETIDDVKEAK